MNSESRTATRSETIVSRIQRLMGLHLSRVPALLVALLAAEFFFKFGSFTLECVAFLALWRVLDFGAESLRRDRTD